MRNYVNAYIGTNFQNNGDGFTGYIDDFRIWTCGSHGTPTYTPTLTITKTWTISQTPTVTYTATITCTHTITPTYTDIITDTITPTFSATDTYTLSPTNTPSPTVTITLTPSMTYTITPTATLTPVPAEFKIFGNFPNPFDDDTRVVLGLPEDCAITLTIYTVSGEKANELAFAGRTGMNSLYVKNCNFSGIRLASGIYLYRIKAVFRNRAERFLWHKFAVSN